MPGSEADRTLLERISSTAVGVGRTGMVKFAAVGTCVAEGTASGCSSPQPESAVTRRKAATTDQIRTARLFQRLFDEAERQQSSPLFMLDQRRDLPAKTEKIRRPG